MPVKPNTMADFHDVFNCYRDVPRIINNELARMFIQGREHWVFESELACKTRISPPLLEQFRGVFQDNIVYFGDKQVWFADPKVAAKARELCK